MNDTQKQIMREAVASLRQLLAKLDRVDNKDKVRYWVLIRPYIYEKIHLLEFELRNGGRTDLGDTYE